jgi:hypothetical protein
MTEPQDERVNGLLQNLGTQMKPIYLVAAHYAPDRYADLLRVLAPAIVITHIDRKTDPTPFHEAAARHPNVEFVSDADRVNVLWGGWSQVAATLAMLTAARPHVEDDDYVILLSGDSFPLQKPVEIARYLSLGMQAQYINTVSMPSEIVSKPISRVSRAYFEYNPRNGRRNLMRRGLNKVGLPRNYKKAFAGRRPLAGSTWWALTGSAILWILQDIERDDHFARFCRLSKMPDEFFFQTILGASPFANDVRAGLMFADWTRPGGAKPALLDDDHIDDLGRKKLVLSDTGYGPGLALFARKVANDHVADRIAAELWPMGILSNRS